MNPDLEIARKAVLKPIVEIGAALGIGEEHLECYGRHKAKISHTFLRTLKDRPDGKLILVTAMSPPPAGGGKTTTSVGLNDALCRLGQRSIVCLREPSLGPCFGMKGGAAGGGYSQVVPMEDINLHFTGDFHAIASAHNLLAAMIDNYIHHGNTVRIDLRRVSWRRVMDMNDRALRGLTVGLGGPANGFPRESGFDIVPASEVMAVFCLSESLADLKQRLERIVVGQTRGGEPVRASEFAAAGAMAALLKDAIKPNLVQTLENNPAVIHGGPFANIAHGCNSVMATRAALKLADYVVTEAGFGADLGAEKFFDIKCRHAGLTPAAAVVVVTLPALRYQGGACAKALHTADAAAVRKGLANLRRHSTTCATTLACLAWSRSTASPATPRRNLPSSMRSAWKPASPWPTRTTGRKAVRARWHSPRRWSMPPIAQPVVSACFIRARCRSGRNWKPSPRRSMGLAQ